MPLEDAVKDVAQAFDKAGRRAAGAPVAIPPMPPDPSWMLARLMLALTGITIAGMAAALYLQS